MNPEEVYTKYRKDFAPKIEGMSHEKLEEIFIDAYKATMPPINPLPYTGFAERITYEFPELTALCPMTALPDTYTVKIEFVPDKLVPELKSLRYYFLAYRDLPIIHELLLDKIHEDFNRAVMPKELKVNLTVAVRGGIYTTIES